MADGTRKPIEQVKPGDLVLSAIGAGRRGPSRVLRVRERRSTRGIVIRTAAGRTLSSTPEHIHFAGYRLGLTPQLRLVYVMRRDGYGFRLGTTSIYTRAQVKPVIGLGHRCLQEGADAAWVISTHANEQDARLAELQLSLRYGIPTLPFVPRRAARSTSGSIIADQAAIDRLFESIDTETSGRRLLRDEGLSEAHPHHAAQSCEGRRRTVTVTVCAANRAHRLAVTGTDAQLAAKLRDAGYAVTRPKRARPDHWRLSLQRADLGELLTESEMIAAQAGARVRLLGAVGTSAAGSAGVSLPLMPASAVRPGMVLATEDGGHDTVVSVEAIELDRPVFDLDIERTHNFIANGIVTHNCIYSWRGAQPRNILAFGERFPAHARIGLGRNFRCRSEILDPAVACVAQNVQREAKALIAMRGSAAVCR